MRRVRSCISAVCLCVCLAGCGGGSGGSEPNSSQPPSPSFLVSLSATSVMLTQGGPAQSVQVSINPQGGFSGTVSITIGQLPSGVVASPASLSLSAGNSGAFAFSASASAEFVQQQVSLEATSGDLSVSPSLQIVVTAPAMADPYHAIGGSMVHGFYDESRQLLLQRILV